MNAALLKQFKAKKLIENFSNYQFFLNESKLDSLGLQKKVVCAFVLQEVLGYPGVKSGITRFDLMRNSYSYGVDKKVQLGWNSVRSGDVAIIMEPGWLSIKYKLSGGSGHGSPWAYDTHVPLLFYGNGVVSGVLNQPTQVEDIVPTLSTMLGIQAPMGCTGKPISEALR
jgi:hypothetical protein